VEPCILIGFCPEITGTVSDTVNFLFIYSYVHTLFGPFSSPCPPFPLSIPQPPRFQQNLFCPFLQFCWREDKRNKKDIAFLLVWDKDSYIEGVLALLPCMCITIQIDFSVPNLFTIWSPSHIDLCHFKVTILAPLQWGHQTLLSFGFPIFPYSSCMCSPLSMWPMSNNITAFVLDLKSTCEGEHMIFDFLSMTNFT
jgi:hypothetical protein